MSYVVGVDTEALSQNLFLSRLSSLQEKVFITYSSQDRMYAVVFSPNSKKTSTLVIGETTKDTLEREGMTSWSDWISQGMPNALLKTTYLVNTESLTITNKSNFSGSKDSDIGRLLSIITTNTLSKIPDSQRKKIGVTPFGTEIDRRKVWNPTVSFEGKIYSNMISDAYMMAWPNDETELEDKRFFIYFAQPSDTIPEPFKAFPTWIESEGRLFLVVRVVDSGILLSTEESS